MRTASSEAKLEEIIDLVYSNNCKAELLLERFNPDESVWERIEDLDEDAGVDWNEGIKKNRYAAFGFAPTVGKVNFSVNNVNAKYDPDSSYPEAGWFTNGTKIRVKGGYLLDENVDAISRVIDFSDSDETRHFNTQTTGGYVTLDVSNAAGLTERHFRELFGSYFDTATYDNSLFSPGAYTVFTVDTEGPSFARLNAILVTCNDEHGAIFWRSVSDIAIAEAGQNTVDSWHFVGATVNGTRTITLDGQLQKRFIQVAVVIDGISWDYDFRITQVKVNYDSRIEWMYKHVYYLDGPSFTDPPEPVSPIVKCEGRDSWQRMTQTDMNLGDISGGVTIDALMKQIADRAGVFYTADSIADLSFFPNRNLATGLERVVKGDDLFEYLMQVINQSGYYYQAFMKYDESIEDDILYVQPFPESYEPSFTLVYKNYNSVGDKKPTSERLGQRVTVLNKDQTPDVEVQLGADLISTSGPSGVTISWSGAAMFRRYSVVINSGTPVITITNETATSVTFSTQSASSYTVHFTVYGCKWSGTPPSYQGEFHDHENVTNSLGLTHKLINPLIVSNDEAAAMAKGFIEKIGHPRYEIGDIKYPFLNLLLEKNDLVMIYGRFIFTQTLWILNGVKHHWDRSDSPGDSTSLDAEDSGRLLSDIGTFDYDDIMDYDSWGVYDMGVGIPTSTDAEIDALTPVEYNVGEAP